MVDVEIFTMIYTFPPFLMDYNYVFSESNDAPSVFYKPRLMVKTVLSFISRTHDLLDYPILHLKTSS